MTKRLFIGIPLSSACIDEINAFMIENQYVNGIRWTPLKNLHITLCFIGDYKTSLVEKLKSEIQEIINNTSAFDMHLEHFQFGPNYKKAYMIWATFKKNNQFADISKELERKILNNPNPKDPKSHITICRFKHIEKSEINFDFPIENEHLMVNKINLYESILKKSGSEYHVLKEFILK